MALDWQVVVSLRQKVVGIAVVYPTTKIMKTVLRRAFILFMFCLAFYYSNDSIVSWNATPVVTSGKIQKYIQ